MASNEETAPRKEKASQPKAPRPSRVEDAGASEERRHVLAALESGLAEVLPGMEILDRDLGFDGAGHADLVAVDPMGRLVLVLLANSDPEQAALEALDTLAGLRRHRALIVRHLGSRQVQGDVPPRLVVIDPASDERLAERLAPLKPAGLEVFGVRTVRSAAGERSYLVAPDAAASGATARADAGPQGVQGFLDALPLPLQALGRELTERMARLDEDLAPLADASTLVWRWNGTVLARVECCGDRLLASVAPHRERATIRAAADVDGVLEGTMALLLEEFDLREPAPEHAAGRVAELVQGDEPLLTQEELEAFRG